MEEREDHLPGPSIVHREPANDFSDSQRAVHLYLCTGDQGVHSVISA